MVLVSLAASVVIPTVMLVGGLAILVAGLVLLVGRRPEPAVPEVRDDPQEAPVLEPASAADEARDVTPPIPTCDWSAELELPSGKRQLLRTPASDACCRWLFSLSESSIDADDKPVEERLYYVGKSTQIGRDGSFTPLQRESIAREVLASPTDLDATMAIVRSPGPSVGSPGWEQLPAESDSEFDDRARRAWELHLDQLRLQGARPTAGRTSEGNRLEHGRRLLLHVTVDRSCEAAQPVIELDAEANVRWNSHQVGGFDHASGQLSAWVLADDLRAGATTPVAPPQGLRSAAVVGHDPPGVSFSCDPDADASGGGWSGTASSRVEKPDFTIDMGVGIEIEAAAVHVDESEVVLHGRASSHLRLRVSPKASEGRPTGPEVGAGPASCACATPAIDVLLGAGAAAGSEAPPLDSTPVGSMRFDARVVQIRRTAAGAWSVAEGDDDPVEDVEERDGSLDEHRAATAPRAGAGRDRAGDGDRSAGPDRRHHAAR
ncbi:MAG: hypothetical protein R3249_06350 [Nitriliruptorales bacterium]|nr:hypothetical protein [Nitriliruptorales bacterium]